MKKKKISTGAVWILLTLIWMCAIWYFSAKPADQSTEMSHETGKVIASIIHRDFNRWEPEKQAGYVMNIDHMVRKGAHFAEYTLLGILMSASFWFNGRRGSRFWLLAWGIGACYAVSDELHQYFVPGRSCQISDMILDSAGVLFGVLCMFFAYRAFSRLYSGKRPG